MKTFQQIYDFCRNDAIYNVYYNVPDMLDCKTRRRYLYYHGTLIKNRGISRAGTFLYNAAQKQLHNFMDGKPDIIRIHVDDKNFNIVDYQNYEGKTIYIIAEIGQGGVIIQYEHPYKSSYENNLIWFIPRSHNTFTKISVAEEVKKHFYKYHLYPAGRYRDLQLEYEVPKEKFVEWYRYDYLFRQKMDNDADYYAMLDKYIPDEPSVSWDDCYDQLRASGVFFDFNCDEFERYDLTDQFYNMCNR